MVELVGSRLVVKGINLAITNCKSREWDFVRSSQVLVKIHFLDSTLDRRRSNSSSKARPLATPSPRPPTTVTGVTVGSATDSGTCSPTERKTVACLLLHCVFFLLSLFFSFNRQWLRTF
jgi:hypothetical protein